MIEGPAGALWTGRLGRGIIVIAGMRSLNTSSDPSSEPPDDWLPARHTQQCAAQSDTARLERLQALRTSLPRLTVPGLELCRDMNNPAVVICPSMFDATEAAR